MGQVFSYRAEFAFWAPEPGPCSAGSTADRKRIGANSFSKGRRRGGFERILEDFRNNNILEEKPRNLDEMIPLIREVAEVHSPGAEGHLEAAQKSEKWEMTVKAVRQGEEAQQVVLERLERLLGLLEEWENYNEIIRAWRELRLRQERLKNKTSKRFQ